MGGVLRGLGVMHRSACRRPGVLGRAFAPGMTEGAAGAERASVPFLPLFRAPPCNHPPQKEASHPVGTIDARTGAGPGYRVQDRATAKSITQFPQGPNAACRDLLGGLAARDGE